MRITFLITAIFVLIPLAHGKVYKCAMPNGQTEYKDRPCSSGSTTQGVFPNETVSPEDVVKGYFKAIADNRLDDAIRYYSFKNLKGNDLSFNDLKENDLPKVKEIVAKLHDLIQSEIRSNGGVDSVSAKIVLKHERGNLVHVTSYIKYKNGLIAEKLYFLVKESVEWKISIFVGCGRVTPNSGCEDGI